MSGDKFMVIGEDKKTLTIVKNTLVSAGFLYIGYISEVQNALRAIRKCFPTLVMVDIDDDFYGFKPLLDVIEEEILASCVLLIKYRSDDIVNYIKGSRVMSFLVKPVHPDAVAHVAESSINHFQRMLEYEKKLKHISDLLENRKVIDKAKWILVEREGLSEEAAYETIRKKSRDKRLPMKDIAEAIILSLG